MSATRVWIWDNFKAAPCNLAAKISTGFGTSPVFVHPDFGHPHFILACPVGQRRYGDRCYQRALTEENDILSNYDSCEDLESHLWTPETSNEITFVKNAFPPVNTAYHLGIIQYVFEKGLHYADNSYGVGVPFYTGDFF